jgi:hypothetical protein
MVLIFSRVLEDSTPLVSLSLVWQMFMFSFKCTYCYVHIGYKALNSVALQVALQEALRGLWSSIFLFFCLMFENVLPNLCVKGAVLVNLEGAMTRFFCTCELPVLV